MTCRYRTLGLSVWTVAVALPMLVVLVPWVPPPVPLQTLDGGFVAVLNHTALNSEFQYGVDLITTTGPLGFLRVDQNWPSTNRIRLAWTIFLVAAIALILTLLVSRGSLARAAAALPILVVALTAGAAGESVPLVVLLGFLVILRNHEHFQNRYLLGLVAALAVAGVGALVLFKDFLLALLLTVGSGFAYWTRTVDPARPGRPLSRTAPALFIVPPLLMTLWLASWWLLAGQELSGVPDYLAASFDVVAGYSEVMDAPCSTWKPVAAALVTFAVVASAALTTLASSSFKGLLPLGLMSLACGIQFKWAITRCSDLRLAQVISEMTVVGVAVFVTSSGRLSSVVSALQAAAATLLTIVLISSAQGHPLPEIRTPHTWTAGLTRFAMFLELDARPGEALAKTSEKIRRDNARLFPFQLSDDATIDWFGDRQGLIIASGLNYRPRPVFQRFTSFNASLGARNSHFLLGKDPPAYVVFDTLRFGNFAPGLLDSRALLALFMRYETKTMTDEVVLLRRAGLRRFRKDPCGAGEALIDEHVSVTQCLGSGFVWLEIEIEASIVGSLRQAVLRPGRVHLDVSSHENRRYRIAPTAATGGLLLSPDLRSADIAARSFNRGGNLPDESIVRRFRVKIGDDYAHLYKEAYRYRLFQLTPQTVRSAP